jgi:hypothetical protein
MLRSIFTALKKLVVDFYERNNKKEGTLLNSLFCVEKNAFISIIRTLTTYRIF